jgi:hypothetical protein
MVIGKLVWVVDDNEASESRPRPSEVIWLRALQPPSQEGQVTTGTSTESRH